MYLCTSSSDPAQMRCSTALLAAAAGAPQSRIRVFRNASADAVPAPQESSPARLLHQGGKEPRKLLGNNRLPSSLSGAAKVCQPRERRVGVAAGPRGTVVDIGPSSADGWAAIRQPAGPPAASDRAASSSSQTAAPRLWRRRAGPQDSPAHETAAQASITKLSPAAAADPVTQDGKCAHFIHQPRPVQGKESTHGGAVQAVRDHELQARAGL